MRLLIRELKLQNFPFVLLAQGHDRIARTINQTILSFKDLSTKTKKDVPELNAFLLAIIEEKVLDEPTRKDWAAFLERVLLPGIRSGEYTVSPQLSATLSSLFRVLTNNASEEDRQSIISYGNYFADRVTASVRNTQSVRMGSRHRGNVSQNADEVSAVPSVTN